jgi:hypothetical protein
MVTIVEALHSEGQPARFAARHGASSYFHFGEFMSLIKGLLKTAVAAKLIQVAQRELSKPENQKKIKDGLRRLQETARSRR